MRFGITLLACLILGAGQLSAQILEGRILDAQSELGIPLAQVTLMDEGGRIFRSVLTDEDGLFSLALPGPDPHYLFIEGLGYFSRNVGPLTVASGDTLTLDFRLQPSPVQLDSMAVSAERRIPALERVGFYRRAAMGQGHFIDRKRIDERVSARSIAQLLVGIPGVRISSSGEVGLTGMPSIRLGCTASVYFNGIRVEDRFWAKEPSMNIEAIEIYRRPSEVPVQYGGAQSGCGVILVWTRRGG